MKKLLSLFYKKVFPPLLIYLFCFFLNIFFLVKLLLVRRSSSRCQKELDGAVRQSETTVYGVRRLCPKRSYETFPGRIDIFPPLEVERISLASPRSLYLLFNLFSWKDCLCFFKVPFDGGFPFKRIFG